MRAFLFLLFFNVLFSVMSGEDKKPNLNEKKKKKHDMKSKKEKKSMWRIRAQRSKEVRTSPKRIRGDFLQTPEARDMFEAHIPLEFENIKTLN